jgi:hypothetical protein
VDNHADEGDVRQGASNDQADTKSAASPTRRVYRLVRNVSVSSLLSVSRTDLLTERLFVMH